MIDVNEHRQVNGNRLLRLFQIANSIAKFLNVESHAKKAFGWLTQTVKNLMWDLWKTVTSELQNVSQKVQNFLGFGEGEEPPEGSIMLLNEPPTDGSIPIW